VYLHYYAIVIILDVNGLRMTIFYCLSQSFLGQLSSSKICYCDRPTTLDIL